MRGMNPYTAYKLSADPSAHDNAMGFRTAGSDAEHRAADFIAEEMEHIGLRDVEKIPVNVDKRQFGGASLTITGTGIALYEAERAKQLTFMGEVLAEEIEDMKAFASLPADQFR